MINVIYLSANLYILYSSFTRGKYPQLCCVHLGVCRPLWCAALVRSFTL